MILDRVILSWCREYHDTEREAEFQAYAKYVALRPWIRGLTRHSIFLWILYIGQLAIAIPHMKTVDAASLFYVAIQLMALNGVCTLAFIPYGLKKYHIGDGTTLFFYILMVVAINLLFGRLPQAGQTAFSVIMMPVSLVLHHILPLLLNKNARQMRAFHATQQLEAEDAQATQDKAEFDSWVNRQQGAGFHDTAELPEGENTGYWALRNWSDVVANVEAMHQDADCMEVIPDEPPQNMMEDFGEDVNLVEDFDKPENLVEDFDDPEPPTEPPVDDTESVEDFYKKLLNEE